MMPPSMESIFLILSGVILAAGVLYWFWSHIQLTQKKVQLLESAVFELRGALTPAPEEKPVQALAENVNVTETENENDWETTPDQQSTPLEALDLVHEHEVVVEPEELQPGGGAKVGDLEEKPADSFRELFIQHDSAMTPVKETAAQESLESMPVRELRRLAEQRGLTGVSDMRKKELLTALRQQITPAESKGNDVVVERTLDLEESPEKSEA